MVAKNAGNPISVALSRLFSNRLMTFAFLDQVIASGSNFVATILLVRGLGLYEFGRFALAWMLVEFIASLQFAAIIQPMLNIGPKQPEGYSRQYYGAVMAQQWAACVLPAVIVGIGVTMIGRLIGDPSLATMALPLSTAIIAYQLYEFFRRYLFASGRPLVGLCIDVLRFGLQIGAILVIPYAWPAATAEVGIWIIGAACAVSVIHGARHFGRIELNLTAFHNVLVRHWEFSKWLLPSAFMYWTTSQAHLLVSGLVLGAAATGALRAAHTITGVLNLLLLALNNFAPVQASRALHGGGPGALNLYIGHLARITAGLIVAVIGVLLIVPEQIVHLLYGEQYQGLSQIVRMLCAPAAAYGIGVVLAIWAAALERTHLIFWSYAVATAFSGLSVFPLAHYGGIVGLVLCLFLIESIKAVMLLIPLIRWSRNRSDKHAQLALATTSPRHEE